MNIETKNKYGWEINNFTNFLGSIFITVLNLLLVMVNVLFADPSTMVQVALVINMLAVIAGIVSSLQSVDITTTQVPLTDSDLLKK